MNLPRLEINSTPAKIEIHTRYPKVEVRGEHAQLQIRQTPIQMRISREDPELIIDQSESFASAGLKSVLQLAQEYYQRARAESMEGIGETARRGWRLMRIQDGETIGRLEFERMLKQQRQLKEVTMPSERPSTQIKPGEVTIDWTPQEVDIYWEPSDRRLVVTPGGVTIYISQYPEMEITLVEGEIGDSEHYGVPSGRNVDVAL